MNSTDVVVSIQRSDDLEKITDKTKYINLSINNVSSSVIDYFLDNGKDYLYSEIINDRMGFVYTDYATFRKGEEIFRDIIKKMPTSLSDIEKVRYIYITLGRYLNSKIDDSLDIPFSNNIWSLMVKRGVNAINCAKIFMYLCERISIKCEMAYGNAEGEIINKVYLGDSTLIVRLFNDIYNIQGGFRTKYFDNYNDFKEGDIKIGYIRDEYMDYYLDKALSGSNYTEDDVLEKILIISSSIIDVYDMGTNELGKLFRDIFDKYACNYNIEINNLYIERKANLKDDFIVFSYLDRLYSFNYHDKCFMKIDSNVLYKSILSNKIAVCDGEEFSLMKRGYAL